jgi:hypothetical protein
MKNILFAGVAAVAMIAVQPAFAQNIGGAVGSTTNSTIGGTVGGAAGGLTGTVGGAAKATTGVGAGVAGNAGSLGAGATSNTGASSAVGGATSGATGATGGAAAGADLGAAATASNTGWAPLAGSAKSDVKVGAKVVNANGAAIGTVSSVTASADGKITGVKIKTSAGATQTASASDLSIKGGVLLSGKVSAQ